MMNKSALVAMSGGVDSSVAALLLKRQGYVTAGITMRMFNNDGVENSCCSSKDVEDAAEVSEYLGIDHFVYSYTDDFREKVMDDFAHCYMRGETPNPCIECNRHIKFRHLIDQTVKMGFDCAATGHYVRVRFDEGSGRYLLMKGLDAGKDQSYVLYSLGQDMLSKLKFPVGELSKKEVRELAHSCGLSVSEKPDSQDICFVPDGDYKSFIEREYGYKSEPGNFTDSNGRVLGRHSGIIGYTVGQRKGLGISGGKPLYVVRKDVGSNTVVVGDNSELFSSVLTARDVNFIPFETLKGSMRVGAKIRYSQNTADCVITPEEDGKVRVEFSAPQRAVTAGQSVVFYDGDTVVGGGKIC